MRKRGLTPLFFLSILLIFRAYRRPNVAGDNDTIKSACPYLIYDEEEALARGSDESIPGNVFTVEQWGYGRTGNYFMAAYRHLALGYCCKSKLVNLPPKDNVLAPGVLGEGAQGPRWFDFSNAPDVEGFDSRSCDKDIKWTGPMAFRMDMLQNAKWDSYNPDLMKCYRKVPRLIECEAAYYFPADTDVCAPDIPGDGDRKEQDGEGELIGGGGRGANNGSSGGGAGNLVLHVRSGDIFSTAVLPQYGQPPLQFYLMVMGHKPWDRVDVVTWAESEEFLNPVVHVLRKNLGNGIIPNRNVHIHTNRSMGEDLRTMLCADALATSRSTLLHLTQFHSRASRMYHAASCRGHLTTLANARPDMEVYGLDWPAEYSVYKLWENTPEQHEEILHHSRIKGFKQCNSTRHHL